MKQIFLLCIILLAAFGPAKAQNTGEKCTDIPYVPFTLNPNPTNVPPSLNPPTPPETTPPIEGYRGIYWVHGLGGNVTSWAQAANATDGIAILGPNADFPARKTVSVRPVYSETSIDDSADDLRKNILKEHDVIAEKVDDFSKNFIIAHSQGGFVSRATEKLLDNPTNTREYYGIVTIGSPHQGAKIIDSRNAGHINQWLADGCNFFAYAKVKDFIASKPIISFFVGSNAGAGAVETLCGLIGNQLVPVALDDLFSGTSNSYATNAPYLAALNAHNNSNTTKVAFYGVEYNTDPAGGDDQYVSKQAVWRLVSSSLANVSEAAPFTADDDQDMVDKANQITAELYGQYQYWYTASLQAQSLCWPFSCDNDEIAAYEAYYQAYQWFDDADYVWKLLIGHRSYGEDPSGIGYCYRGPNQPDSYERQTSCMTSGGVSWYPNTVLLVKPSDGVVLAESAKTWPGVDAVGKPMEGSNHFQMRNDSQLKLRLKELYNGDVDPWFITEVQ